MLKPIKKINYLTILQTLHLQLGPNHVLINSLNFVIDVNDFIFVGSLFHILGSRAVKLLSPWVAAQWNLSNADTYGAEVFVRLREVPALERSELKSSQI